MVRKYSGSGWDRWNCNSNADLWTGYWSIDVWTGYSAGVRTLASNAFIRGLSAELGEEREIQPVLLQWRWYVVIHESLRDGVYIMLAQWLFAGSLKVPLPQRLPLEEDLRRKMPAADVKQFADFLGLMFQLDPVKRASFKEILVHPWLNV
jgi:serine/threonine protein kinase